MVVPDNVLFEEGAGKEVRKLLLEDCNLHTILRLPAGTFTPYSPAVKANIIFFTKGDRTQETWVYDDRTNVEKVAIRNPLNRKHFEDFEKCYHAKPRKELDRFRRFTRQEISKRSDNLDVFWLRAETVREGRRDSEPDEILGEAIGQVQIALDSLNDLSLILSAIKSDSDD